MTATDRDVARRRDTPIWDELAGRYAELTGRTAAVDEDQADDDAR